MAHKSKINLEQFNDIEMISSNEENAVYRVQVSQDSIKNLTLEEKQKLKKNFSDTTVLFFDIDDLNKLKEIEQTLMLNYNEEKQKRGFFHFLYNFLEI